jgi:hypothetical protein
MDAGNAGRGPSHALGFFALDPGPYRAFEGNLAAVGFDDDAVGIELGVTPERLFNLILDLLWPDTGLELDHIADALDAFDPAHGIFRRLTLVLPFDSTFQRHPAVLDDDFDILPRDWQVGLNRCHRIARDIGIWSLVYAWQANFEVVSHSGYSSNTFCRGLGLVFIAIALDVTRQGDDAALQRGEKIVKPRERPSATVIDLIEALRQTAAAGRGPARKHPQQASAEDKRGRARRINAQARKAS